MIWIRVMSNRKKGSSDTQVSDEILDLNDSKTLEKLKNEGLSIVQKTAKPNPLILMVKIDSQTGDLQLNTENVGNVLEKNNLEAKLSEVFKQREKNRGIVYLPNNTMTKAEVVKAVTMSVNPLIKTDYFYKTLDILKKLGATPIYLSVENSDKNIAENKTSGCQITDSIISQSQKIKFSSASSAITPDTKTALESLAADFILDLMLL